jgi:hypothetical protein
MRMLSIVAVASATLVITSCGGGGPTEREINQSLDATLQSVAGDWTGVTGAPNPVRLEFRLQASSTGQLTGTGTMKEESAASPVPVTVTGTFQRPMLTLAFDGMVFESRQVKGAAQGSYTTVGGIATTLTLTAPGYSRELNILLQEK